MALIDVALLTVNEGAGVVPKVTLVAPVKPVPVMFTAVPPAVGPDTGEMPVTVGITGTTPYVNLSPAECRCTPGGSDSNINGP